MMRSKNIGYWATTGLTALAFLAGGAGDLAGSPAVAGAMTHLGYPAYFALILGSWKVLAATALLVPRFPRLKEWAYAGILFDLTGAALSHGFAGDAAGKVVTPLALLAIALVSWALRPDSRRLPSLAPASTSLRHAPLNVAAPQAAG